MLEILREGRLGTIAKQNDSIILNVKSLKKYFPIHKGFFQKVVGYTKAVDGIDFSIKKGETVGLVGESGSGKTTVGRCIVRLYEPTEGNIEFCVNGEMKNLTQVPKKEMMNIRKHFQMLFQDPYSSLNSRLKVGDIIKEPLVIHNIGTPKERTDKAKEVLEKVGLSIESINKYPHQFSGGQRQRIGIARALSINPDFVICDEPVSALDVSIQAQVLNLLFDLQDEYNLSYLFIAHDLSVVEYISDRVMVMYLGKIVEIASSEEIYKNPGHPYTEALMASIPKYKSGSTRGLILKGTIPDPSNPPSGCVFHTRCNYGKQICREEIPVLESKDEASGSLVACHRYKELSLRGL